MAFNHTGLTPTVLSYVAPDPPVKEFTPARDRAFYADPAKKSLFSSATSVKNLTPFIGTELTGVQLSTLSPSQKDELALLAAERGVVFFRDQDLSIEGQYELTKHFGLQDRDPSQQDARHVTILGRNDDIRAFANFGAEFHNDHSYEANPPAYTMLRMVKTPEVGGDTIFTSQPALYDKLSPAFKTLLEGLQGLHTSEHSYVNAINGGYKPFRGPVRRLHPLIRTHPVTRVKSLFWNPSFVIHLEGIKGGESAHVSSFLREHLHAADDLTVRWKWEVGSVAFWDNRVIAHRAVPGGYDPKAREGKRTAIYGEKPYFDPEGVSLSEWLERREGKLSTTGHYTNGFVDPKVRVTEEENGKREEGTVA